MTSSKCVSSPSLKHRSGHRSSETQRAFAASRSNGESDQKKCDIHPPNVASPSQNDGSKANSDLVSSVEVPESRELAGGKGQRESDAQVERARPSASEDGGEVRVLFDSRMSIDFPAFLQHYHDWLYMRRTQFGLDNACGAMARSALGWKYADGNKSVEKQNAKVIKTAAAIVNSIKEEGEPPKGFEAQTEAVRRIIIAYQRAKAAFDPDIKVLEAVMKSAMSQLPVAKWADGIRGFGSGIALVRIIGETGDLSNYPNPAKVWKRLGLAPHNGQAYSTWRLKGGLSGQEWVDAGYKPSRRSSSFVVGESLLKLNDGKYRAKYDARRAHTATTHADWTKGHSHMDAMRIMIKELVKDLWVEWHKAK